MTGGAAGAESGRHGPPGPGTARLLTTAAATGGAVMVLEVMGVRLMAPWFGQSQLVWTHVIGVVLAALAVGQWWGGRWADAGRGPAPATLLAGSGVFGLGLPEAVAWLGRATLPDDLTLLEAHPFVSLGSLLTALLALGLPMLALGAVTPWLVRLSQDAARHPGRVVGRLLGMGTLGSLAGTFGATYVLLPAVGAAGAVRIAGGALLLCAVVIGRHHRGPTGRSCALLACALGLPLAGPGVPRLDGEVARVETAYQLARVVEHPDGSRALLLNEGLDSFHSLWTPGEVLTGMYYDAFLVPALAAPTSEGRRKVLIIGLAAGTMARQVLRHDPEARVVGVEIDDALIDLGRRWFELPEAVEVVSGADGRTALARTTERFGAVLVDAYSQQIYLPPHLTTVEFFELVEERLLPGGWAALNVGGLTVDDPVVAAVCATFSRVFPGATVVPVPGTRNLVLLGRRDAGVRDGLRDAAGVLAALGLEGSLGWMLDAERHAATAEIEGQVLTDGHAPTEHLAHRSWSGDAVAAGPSGPPAGHLSPDALLSRAATMMGQTRWAQAEGLLRRATELSDPELRARAWLLLGNLAYGREDVPAALSAYAEVGDLVPADSPMAVAAADNARSMAAAGLRQQALAEREARLRAWTLAVAAVGLLGVLWMTRLPS